MRIELITEVNIRSVVLLACDNLRSDEVDVLQNVGSYKAS